MGKHNGVSPVPPRASDPVKCSKSSTGKHQPTTKEAVYQGGHIKFSVCTVCKCSLK